MANCMIVSYRREISLLNSKLFKENLEQYNAIRDYVEIQEFNEGFKIKKVNKPTSKGTKITFEIIKDEEEYQKCYKDISTRLAYMIETAE